MPYIKSNGVKLYYEETGKGYPIVFVHEFGSDFREWEQQVRYFSREYRCITFNARGYPPSGVPNSLKKYGYKYSVDDIANLMKQLKINKAHIVGLSMGAYAALIFGLKYKGMVKSLVIAGVGSGAMPEHKNSFYDMANELADIFLKKGSKVAANIISNSGSRVQLKNKDPRGWNEFKNHLEEHSKDGSAFTMKQYQALRPSLMEFKKEFKKMNLPVFLAVGDEDELCIEINIYLKRLIKSSGLWVSPKTGHAINLEEPAEFNTKVQNFFSTVERNNWKNRDKVSVKDIK